MFLKCTDGRSPVFSHALRIGHPEISELDFHFKILKVAPEISLKKSSSKQHKFYYLPSWGPTCPAIHYSLPWYVSIEFAVSSS